jgi:hypothetical protein
MLLPPQTGSDPLLIPDLAVSISEDVVVFMEFPEYISFLSCYKIFQVGLSSFQSQLFLRGSFPRNNGMLDRKKTKSIFFISNLSNSQSMLPCENAKTGAASADASRTLFAAGRSFAALATTLLSGTINKCLSQLQRRTKGHRRRQLWQVSERVFRKRFQGCWNLGEGSIRPLRSVPTFAAPPPALTAARAAIAAATEKLQNAESEARVGGTQKKIYRDQVKKEYVE